MERVTKADVESAIKRLKIRTGVSVVPESAHGKLRLFSGVEIKGKMYGGGRAISPRLGKRALIDWIDAFIDGYETREREEQAVRSFPLNQKTG